MAMGLFLASYTRKYLTSGLEDDAVRASSFAQWLDDNRSKGFAGACWGYDFDWPNRGFFAPAGTPTVVNTGLNGLALLDSGPGSSTLLDGPFASRIHSSRSIVFHNGLALARSACEFVLRDLNTARPRHDELCFSYTPLDHRFVHNANLFGAWLLAEVWRHTGEPILLARALAAARYTAHRQRPDGSWPYGEAQSDAWIDNFHTGFVLVALKRIGRCLNTDEFNEAVEDGYRFWKTNMFRRDGAPKYYSDRLYPIDIHSLAQAALTFAEFSESDEEAFANAHRVLQWAIRHMRDARGYFYYRKTRAWMIRIPYMRWAQAWMQRAFTEFLGLAECDTTARVSRSLRLRDESEVFRET